MRLAWEFRGEDSGRFDIDVMGRGLDVFILFIHV